MDEFLQLDSDNEADINIDFLKRFEKIPVNAFRKYRKKGGYGNLKESYSKTEVKRMGLHNTVLSERKLGTSAGQCDLFMNDIV